DFLRDVVGEPAHLVASALPGAVAVRAAREHPHPVGTLVLIFPTGIEGSADAPTPGQHIAHVKLGSPVLGPRLFALLVARPAIRYYVRSITYHQRSKITPDVV